MYYLKEFILLLIAVSLTTCQDSANASQNNDSDVVDAPDKLPSGVPPPSPLDDCDPEMVG